MFRELNNSTSVECYPRLRTGPAADATRDSAALRSPHSCVRVGCRKPSTAASDRSPADMDERANLDGVMT
jgi:hypothetical protein